MGVEGKLIDVWRAFRAWLSGHDPASDPPRAADTSDDDDSWMFWEPEDDRAAA